MTWLTLNTCHKLHGPLSDLSFGGPVLLIYCCTTALLHCRDEAKEQVDGFAKAEHKKFESKRDARKYISALTNVKNVPQKRHATRSEGSNKWAFIMEFGRGSLLHEWRITREEIVFKLSLNNAGCCDLSKVFIIQVHCILQLTKALQSKHSTLFST